MTACESQTPLVRDRQPYLLLNLCEELQCALLAGDLPALELAAGQAGEVCRQWQQEHVPGGGARDGEDAVLARLGHRCRVLRVLLRQQQRSLSLMRLQAAGAQGTYSLREGV